MNNEVYVLELTKFKITEKEKDVFIVEEIEKRTMVK